ncbi:MAG: cation:proton antiporter [Trueperaceae bacterium]
MNPVLELGSVALGLYLAGWLAQRLGLASIVGYIALGLAFGPGSPVPIYTPSETIHLFGELGLLMLLFFMGLEFSPARFTEGGRAIVVAGTIDLANFAVGFAAGMLLGYGWLAGLFLGGITYISSSGVIAKLLTEKRLLAYPEAERTLGVLVYEDLAMIAILGGLGLLTAGGGWQDFLGVAVALVAFGALLRWGRRPLERLLSREGETFVLLAIALIALGAMGAHQLGFPEAVAAFLLGMMLAESRHKERLEETLVPWRDVAAAVFFLDFALSVDLGAALAVAPIALVLALVTALVNLGSGYLAGRVTELSHRASIGHGLMLIPRGEFSLVIVGLAASVSVLPEGVRTALTGITSVYVLTLVVAGSFVFVAYDRINERLAYWLLSPAARRRLREREQQLARVHLDA